MVRPVAANRAAAGKRLRTLPVKVSPPRVKMPARNADSVKAGELDRAVDSGKAAERVKAVQLDRAEVREIAVRAARAVVADGARVAAAVTAENSLSMPGDKNAEYYPTNEEELLTILFVAKDFERFSALVARLRREHEVRLVPAAPGPTGLEKREGKPMDVVIVDEQLDDMSGIDFVKQLVMVNPLVNTAIVGDLSKKDFHEATEGLGVLMQLPRHPQERDAEALLAILEKISGLLQPKKQQVSP